MTGFGGYETVREIHRSGGKSVWTARKAGTRGDFYAIRWVEPATTHWSDEDARREIASFLERAEIQKKAAAGGKFWAPIFAHGESAGGAALVTRNYRRTAEELIQGKVTVSAGGLHRIVRAVVRGLQQLQRTCGRPHGALRPSSVLIGGKRRLSQATVVLCSPSPAADVQHRDEKCDFAALGELIFQLVTHRPFKRVKLPLQDSEEWVRLGRKGSAWRKLCSDLLDPSSPTAPADLAELRRRVRKLAPAPVRKRTVIATVVIVAFVAAAAFFTYRITRDPRAEWDRLCYEYETWTRRFVEDAAADAFDPKGDSELAAILARAKEMGDNPAKSDPRYILPTSQGRQYYQLIELWTELRNDSAALVTATETAPRMVSDLRKKLSTWLDHANQPVAKLRELVNRDAKESTAVLRELDQMTVPLPPELREVKRKQGGNVVEILKSPHLHRVELPINQLRERDPIVADLLQRWPKVQHLIAQISNDEHAKKDALLKQFHSFGLDQLVSARSLEEMHATVTRLQSIGEQLSQTIAGRWKDDGFPVKATAPTPAGTGDFEDWIKAAATDLPTSQFAKWSQDNAARLANRDALADLIKQPEFETAAKATDEKFEAVNARFAQLRERKWTELANDQVAAELRALNDQLTEANKALGSLEEALNQRAVAMNNAVDGVKSKALNARWVDLKEEALRARAVGQLEQVLRFMDTQCSAEIASIGQGAPVWLTSLHEQYQKQREELLELAAKDLTVRSLARPDAGKARLAELTALDKHGKELVAECATLEAMLSLLMAGNESTTTGGPTLAEMVTAIQAHGKDQQGRDLLLVAAVKDLINRGARAVAVNNWNRADLLKPDNWSDDTLWPVWKRLRAADNWPGSSGDLDVEISLRKALALAVRPLPHDRAALILQELERSKVDTASTCILQVARRGSPIELEQRLAELKVNVADLPDEPRYRFALAVLQRDLTAAHKDDQARAAVMAFNALIRSASKPEVVAELNRLNVSISDETRAYEKIKGTAVIDDETGIEKLLGCGKTVIDPPANRALVFKHGKTQLEFICIDESKSPATFICTTEVTLGFFIDVLEAMKKSDPKTGNPKKASDLISKLRAWDKSGNDTRKPPRVWAFNQDQLQAAPWIEVAVRDGDLKLVVPADMKQPDLQFPMQHIKPSHAREFAEWIGCRLPTQEEWSIAHRQYPSQAQPNLRDKSWREIYTPVELNASGKKTETGKRLAAAYKTFDDLTADEAKDGYAWLKPQPIQVADNQFHDLVGNVAEWVTLPTGFTGVVGGSALTRLPKPPDQPVEIDVGAYPDVGFRLALEANVHSLGKSLRGRLVKDGLFTQDAPPAAAPAGTENR